MNRLKNGGKDNHRVIISRYCLKHFLVSSVIQLKDRLSIVFTRLCVVCRLYLVQFLCRNLVPLLFFHVYLGLQCTVLEKSLYSGKSVKRVLICGRILSVFWYFGISTASFILAKSF